MEIAKKLAAYEEMKTNYKDAEQIYQEKENYRQLCEALYQEGIIKQDEKGVIVPVDDPMERESIKSKSKQKFQNDGYSGKS